LVFSSNLYREISLIFVQTFFGKVERKRERERERETLESDLFETAFKVKNSEVLSEMPFLRKSYFKKVFKGF